ncbi:hypothetical protein F5883DRAFT_59907 [Diaporthe sp. PMI_573]|nr:hypothetical protein F5883DRAFT_59907 [Diaporthaceae sp. PMI_573]
MASTQASGCQRASSFSVSEIKPNVEEYISPDILHIFREDKVEAPAGPLTPSPKASTSARSEEKPSQFPQFQRLPPEIRYLIWEAAVPEPTVVPRTWNNAKFRYNLQRGVPAVLQACAESRALLVAQTPGAASGVAPPKYELVRTPGREDEGVYMDFDRDSIWVYRGCEFGFSKAHHFPISLTRVADSTSGGTDDINDAEVSACSGLRSLVMNWGLRPCWVDSAVDKGVRFVRKFPGLRLLTLLVDFNEHGWPDPSTLKGLRRLKRDEVKRIWALVRAALRRAEEEDPGWTAPRLHIVHRTEKWCRREAR